MRWHICQQAFPRIAPNYRRSFLAVRRGWLIAASAAATANTATAITAAAGVAARDASAAATAVADGRRDAGHPARTAV
jgi:hypothetical protein